MITMRILFLSELQKMKKLIQELSGQFCLC